VEIQGIGMPTDNLLTSDVTLTDEQKSLLEEILAKYDSENLSDEDRASLMDELKNSGIPRCREAFQMIEAAGLAPERPQGPPPPPPSDEDDDSTQTDALSQLKSDILTLVEQLLSGQITEDEFRSQLEELLPEDAASTGAVINETV